MPSPTTDHQTPAREHQGRAFLATPVFAGAQPWFVGDDVTDDDGFSACSDLGGGGVLVGDRENSTADFALANVARTIEWLGL